MSEAEKFMKTNIEVIKRTTEDPGLEASGEYSKSTIRGLEDRCPIKNGSGCNPYSCQEVPY